MCLNPHGIRSEKDRDGITQQRSRQRWRWGREDPGGTLAAVRPSSPIRSRSGRRNCSSVRARRSVGRRRRNFPFPGYKSPNLDYFSTLPGGWSHGPYGECPITTPAALGELAHRRDVHQGPRPVGVSVPCARQVREHDRFLSLGDPQHQGRDRRHRGAESRGQMSG